ncbi:P-loop NTPase [Nocardioides sp. SR21]|uniref:AAA family ATPase n=1 Tax=Nocardioides sp. SR21 TaxID=2919501 RepID=UPI001FAAF5D0|nr:P-loop NTPase [Nocardioides sp. SR21]
MTTIIEPDQDVAEKIRQAVPGAVSLLGSADRLAGHLDKDPAEQTLVVGPSMSVEDAVGIAERLRVERPALGVVLVRTVVDRDILPRAMRAGVREVVSIDDPAALSHAVRRAQAVARAMIAADESAERVPGGLLTVFSAKGGVGKSFLSTNLSAALADLGHRVCLVDLDIEGGSDSLMLSLTPQHTLADLHRFRGNLDTSALESLTTVHSPGLSVLPAPIHLGATVEVAAIGPVLDQLKGMYDAVVVDTSGSFDDYALQAFDRSDLLVLIGTLDMPSLKNLKLAVGTLDLLNYPRDLWRLAVNRADPRVGLSVEEVEQTLGIAATVTIPSSRDVLVSVNRGVPLVRSNGGHPASKAIVSLANQLSLDVALPGRTPERGRLRRVGRGRKAA